MHANAHTDRVKRAMGKIHICIRYQLYLYSRSLAYNPRPVDLSNMTLDTDMQSLGERIAENSHLIWSKATLEHLANLRGSMPLTIVPWDLLTDFERRKDRFRSQEVIKFLQYHGYKIVRLVALYSTTNNCQIEIIMLLCT